MRNMIVMTLLAAWLIAGCGSTNPTGQYAGIPEFPGADDLTQAHENRLDDAPTMATCVLNGSVAVSGFKLAPASGPGTGTGGSYKILAHLMDEEDDILSAKVGNDGSFSFTYGGSKTELKLKITIDTTEDLNADGAVNDQIVQTVPVRLLAGYVATASMAIKRGAKTVIDKTLFPARGAVVVNDVIKLDGNGRDTIFYGSFLADGFALSLHQLRPGAHEPRSGGQKAGSSGPRCCIGTPALRHLKERKMHKSLTNGTPASLGFCPDRTHRILGILQTEVAQPAAARRSGA